MKKKLFVGVFAFVLVNLNIYNKEKNAKNDIQLNNIVVLQSSAKESNCDKSTRNTCEVDHFPPSTGVLTVYE